MVSKVTEHKTRTIRINNESSKKAQKAYEEIADRKGSYDVSSIEENPYGSYMLSREDYKSSDSSNTTPGPSGIDDSSYYNNETSSTSFEATIGEEEKLNTEVEILKENVESKTTTESKSVSAWYSLVAKNSPDYYLQELKKIKDCRGRKFTHEEQHLVDKAKDLLKRSITRFKNLDTFEKIFRSTHDYTKLSKELSTLRSIGETLENLSAFGKGSLIPFNLRNILNAYSSYINIKTDLKNLANSPYKDHERIGYFINGILPGAIKNLHDPLNYSTPPVMDESNKSQALDITEFLNRLSDNLNSGGNQVISDTQDIVNHIFMQKILSLFEVKLSINGVKHNLITTISNSSLNKIKKVINTPWIEKCKIANKSSTNLKFEELLKDENIKLVEEKKDKLIVEERSLESNLAASPDKTDSQNIQPSYTKEIIGFLNGLKLGVNNSSPSEELIRLTENASRNLKKGSMLDHLNHIATHLNTMASLAHEYLDKIALTTTHPIDPAWAELEIKAAVGKILLSIKNNSTYKSFLDTLFEYALSKNSKEICDFITKNFSPYILDKTNPNINKILDSKDVFSAYSSARDYILLIKNTNGSLYATEIMLALINCKANFNSQEVYSIMNALEPIFIDEKYGIIAQNIDVYKNYTNLSISVINMLIGFAGDKATALINAILPGTFYFSNLAAAVITTMMGKNVGDKYTRDIEAKNSKNTLSIFSKLAQKNLIANAHHKDNNITSTIIDDESLIANMNLSQVILHHFVNSLMHQNDEIFIDQIIDLVEAGKLNTDTLNSAEKEQLRKLFTYHNYRKADNVMPITNAILHRLALKYKDSKNSTAQMPERVFLSFIGNLFESPDSTIDDFENTITNIANKFPGQNDASEMSMLMNVSLAKVLERKDIVQQMQWMSKLNNIFENGIKDPTSKLYVLGNIKHSLRTLKLIAIRAVAGIVNSSINLYVLKLAAAGVLVTLASTLGAILLVVTGGIIAAIAYNLRYNKLQDKQTQDIKPLTSLIEKEVVRTEEAFKEKINKIAETTDSKLLIKPSNTQELQNSRNGMDKNLIKAATVYAIPLMFEALPHLIATHQIQPDNKLYKMLMEFQNARAEEDNEEPIVNDHNKLSRSMVEQIALLFLVDTSLLVFLSKLSEAQDQENIVELIEDELDFKNGLIKDLTVFKLTKIILLINLLHTLEWIDIDNIKELYQNILDKARNDDSLNEKRSEVGGSTKANILGMTLIQIMSAIAAATGTASLIYLTLGIIAMGVGALDLFNGKTGSLKFIESLLEHTYKQIEAREKSRKTTYKKQIPKTKIASKERNLPKEPYQQNDHNFALYRTIKVIS